MTAALAIATREALGLTQDPVLNPLPMAGSDRYYWRVWLPDGGRCVLGTHEGKRPENARFAPLARFLDRQGLRVPRILAENVAERRLWLEDLGDRSLESIATRGNAAEIERAYTAAVEEIARLHSISPESAATIGTDLQLPFDAALYRWEQGYFCDHFVTRHTGVDAATVDAVRRHPALAAMAEELGALPRSLVHRDCQSQNILVQPDGRAALIDFQGLRHGLPEYDLASLLYDPYVTLPAALQEELFLRYHAARGTDAGASRPILLACGLQRLMQALGAYANLADKLGKSWYLGFIPVAAARLRELARRHPAGEALAPALA